MSLRTKTKAISSTLKASLLISTIFCSFGQVHAQTLNEALGSAYSTNPSLDAARYQTRSVDESVPQAKAGYRPTFQITGDTGFQETEIDGVDADTDPSSLGAQITQPLYRGGRTVSSVSQAENNVKSSQSSLLSAEQSVLLDAVTAYMNVVRDKAVLELNTNNERVLQRQLQATRDRFEVGEVTRTDVSQAESRKARSTSDRIQSLGNLSTSEANFERIVGMKPVDLQKPESVSGLPTSLDEAIALAKATNPNLKAARYALAASKDNIAVVQGEVYPEVNAVASYSKDWEPASTIDEQDNFAGLLQLSVPLYQGGAVAARVRSAKHINQQRRLELQDTDRLVEEATIQAWEFLSTARASIVSRKAQVRAAQIALDGVTQEATVGSRTVLDTLDAEQELLDARVNLVSAQRDEVVASYQLLAAVGKLTAEELGLDVKLYDPVSHYNKTEDRWWGFETSRKPY